MHQAPPNPPLGDTRNKPGVFISFSLYLGSPVVDNTPFFHGLVRRLGSNCMLTENMEVEQLTLNIMLFWSHR